METSAAATEVPYAATSGGKKAGMKLLGKVYIFSKLDPTDIEELSQLTVIKTWEADTAIFFQGEPSDSLYLLLKGSVKVTETSKEGQPKILGILEEGEIFGELAMLDGRPRSATVTTCAPSTTASISRQDFRDFAATRPDVLWKVLEALCDRVRKTSYDILEMSTQDVAHRLLTALTQLAGKHGQVQSDGSCLITLKISLRDLSAMVGAKTDEVSRLLHRYEVDGLIELGKDRQLIVRDRTALARAVEYSTEWS
jgi:CRP/FNR family cyclic AMP-dependent transcriptional regulator